MRSTELEGERSLPLHFRSRRQQPHTVADFAVLMVAKDLYCT